MGDTGRNYRMPAERHPGKHVVHRQTDEDSKNPKEEHAVNGMFRVSIGSEMDSGPDDSSQENSAVETIAIHQLLQEQSAKNDFF